LAEQEISAKFFKTSWKMRFQVLTAASMKFRFVFWDDCRVK
jgi:hypothetical protein